jgi:hypothetical protein
MTDVPAPDPLKKASNIPYVIAVVVMVLIGVVSILTVVILRPEKDNSQLIATIVSLIVPTTAAILALMKAQETHITVNSQLSQWKVDYANLMRAQGGVEATVKEQDRVALMKEKAIAGAALSAVAGLSRPAQDEPIKVKVEDSDPVRVEMKGKP